MSVNTPTIIPKPFASNGRKGTIPITSAEFGHASWDKGFPVETSLTLGQGGVPPRYEDMQGVLNALSEHVVFQQSGSVYPWNSSLDYLVGAHVIGTDNKEYIAIRSNGVSSTVMNPINDSSKSYWKLLDDTVGAGVLDEKTVIAEGTDTPRQLKDWMGDIVNIKERMADVISVKDFGAVGDGSTLNQEAFDRAVQSGKTLFIPSGEYIINGLFLTRPTHIIAAPDAIIRRKHWNRTYYTDRGMYLSEQASYGPQSRSGLVTIFPGASGTTIYGGIWDMNAWEYIDEYNVNDLKAVAEQDPAYDFQSVIFSRYAHRLKIENVELRGATMRALNIQNSDYSVVRNVRMFDSEGGFQISIGKYQTIENLYCERISNRVRHAADSDEWKTGTDYLITYQHNSVLRQNDYSNIRGIIFSGYAPLEGTGTEPQPGMLNLERVSHANISDIVMTNRVNVEGVTSVGLSMFGCNDLNVSNLDIHDHVLSINSQGCVDCHIDNFHIDNNWFAGAYESLSMGVQLGNGAWAQHGNDSSTDMFFAAQSRNVKFSNGEIHNAYVGVELQGSDAVFENVHARGCYVGYNLREVDEHGKHLESLNNVFRGCSAKNCGKAGIQINNQGNVVLDGVELVGNGWDTNVTATSRVGLYIGGTTEYCEVTNCKIYNEASISKPDGFSCAPSAPTVITAGTNRYPYRFTFLSPNPTQFCVGQVLSVPKLFNGAVLYCHVISVLRDSITVGWTQPIATVAATSDQLVPLSGTVSNVGKTVTGVGTKFTTEIIGSTYIKIGNDFAIVAKVNSDTSLGLASTPSQDHSNVSASLVHIPVWIDNAHQQYGTNCTATSNHSVYYKNNVEHDNAVSPIAISQNGSMCADSEFKKTSGVQNLAGKTNAYCAVVQPYDVPQYWKFRVTATCTGITSFLIRMQVGSTYTTLAENVSPTAGTIASGVMPNVPQAGVYYLQCVAKASGATATVTAGSVYGYVKVRRSVPNEFFD